MAQEMLFGFCYMPQVLRVEDFSPYWVLDRWTPERMIADLKIMRALGSSVIRIHITPPVPGATAYDRLGDRRTVPITGEKYLEMYDLLVRTAHDLGMRIHFDIGSSFSEVSEASLEGWITRYRGLVESYQFANENYAVFESDMAEGNPASFERFDRLLRYARRLDPTARFTADLFSAQIEHIRTHYPDLYAGLDVLSTHPYYCADHRGWTPPYLQELTAIHTPNAVRPTALPWRPDMIFMQRFAGVADFGKELWVTEIVATGDGVWSSLVPEAVKASGWHQVVDALAACAQVTRLYYCWFTDKMHTMEAGVTQLGVVRYDGAPRELTTAFHETAVAHAPVASLIHRLHIAIAETTITPTDTVASLTFRLHNRGEEPLVGRASLELPPGLTADWASFAFELAPGQTIAHSIPLRVGALREAANHVFLRVEATGQVHYGWSVVNCPQSLALDAKGPGIPHVSYLPDLDAVQDFLTRYGDQCAIVVGPGTGHWDVELGYRIKIVLESLRGRSVPIVTWFMLPEVWDRPLIIVGRPTFNYCAQLVELALPAERRADGQKPGAGFVQRVERPLGEPIGSWDSEVRGKLVGFHACPAALYIAGGDDAGSKAAVYDLIGRLWHPSAVPVPKAHWL